MTSQNSDRNEITGESGTDCGAPTITRASYNQADLQVAHQITGESDALADHAGHLPPSQVAHQHESGGVEGNAGGEHLSVLPVWESRSKPKQASAESGPLSPPPGWKLVPIEPTSAMEMAGMKAARLLPRTVSALVSREQIWAAYKAALDAAPSCPLSPQWISVTDRLPEEKQIVLMIGINFGPRKNYTTDTYCGWLSDGHWYRWVHSANPTHWMPLPPAPESE